MCRMAAPSMSLTEPRPSALRQNPGLGVCCRAVRHSLRPVKLDDPPSHFLRGQLAGCGAVRGSVLGGHVD